VKTASRKSATTICRSAASSAITLNRNTVWVCAQTRNSSSETVRFAEARSMTSAMTSG
jgi:hypothetical protein